MQIVKIKTIRLFYEDYPDAKTSFEEWIFKTLRADWNNFHDVKETFNSVDYVGKSRYVFNIKGNQFRIVVMIFFIPKLVYIRFIGTHKEYDKIDCAEI